MSDGEQGSVSVNSSTPCLASEENIAALLLQQRHLEELAPGRSSSEQGWKAVNWVDAIPPRF